MAEPISLRRPPGGTHAIPTPIRAMAGELSVTASRTAATLDRAWAHDAAIDRLGDELADLAERALMLRRHLAEWRRAEAAKASEQGLK